MARTVGYLALGLLVLAPSFAAAQQAKPVRKDSVVVIDHRPTVNLANAGDFAVGIGRPTTFDDMRLDVRENLRPRQSYGPVSNITCSPSIPDC